MYICDCQIETTIKSWVLILLQLQLLLFGMVDLLEQLFSVKWQEEIVPRQWREGLIVNIFKKGDREDPANYRGITLLSVVGKVFCKILNNRLVQCLDKGVVLHEGQADFRINRSCMGNVYTLNEIVQGRLREDKKIYIIMHYS